MLVLLLQPVLLFGNLKRPVKRAKDVRGKEWGSGEGELADRHNGARARTVELQAKLAIMGVMATPG